MKTRTKVLSVLLCCLLLIGLGVAVGLMIRTFIGTGQYVKLKFDLSAVSHHYGYVTTGDILTYEFNVTNDSPTWADISWQYDAPAWLEVRLVTFPDVENITFVHVDWVNGTKMPFEAYESKKCMWIIYVHDPPGDPDYINFNYTATFEIHPHPSNPPVVNGSMLIVR